MKSVEFGEGIIEGAPVVRRPDHQRRQVEHAGTFGFKQPAAFPLLFGGSGHHHRASVEAVAHARPLPSSFTIASARSRSWLACSCWPWLCSSVIAVRKLLRAASMLPPSSWATARF